MKRVPHAQNVRQAIRSVQVAAQRSLKGLNQVASQCMSKGDYATAETLAAKGKEIRQFQTEVDALRKRWREVCGSGGGNTKSATPLWAYYQPILRALKAVGGESRRATLEAEVERVMGSTLLPGDQLGMARGRERWRVMVQRARKHLVGEGWIENGSGTIWKITDAGRRAADSATSKGLEKQS